MSSELTISERVVRLQGFLTHYRRDPGNTVISGRIGALIGELNAQPQEGTEQLAETLNRKWEKYSTAPMAEKHSARMGKLLKILNEIFEVVQPTRPPEAQEDPAALEEYENFQED